MVTAAMKWKDTYSLEGKSWPTYTAYSKAETLLCQQRSEELSTEELMLLNCGVGEDSWESLGLQGNPTVHPKGDQSWVFIERTDAEAETPIFGHLMRRADSFEKTLMLGKIEGRRRRGWQRMRWLDGITNSMDINSGSWWWTGRPGVLWSMGSQRVGHNWVTEPNGACRINFFFFFNLFYWSRVD